MLCMRCCCPPIPPSGQEYLLELDMAFEQHDDTVFDGAKAVAAQFGLRVHPGPPKKPSARRKR